MRHVAVMTATGSVGLIAVFFVDVLTLLYVSHLGNTDLTAAVGYASQILFLMISVNIGFSIAIGALVSRALGAGDRTRARSLASSGLLQVGAASVGLIAIFEPLSRTVLVLLGARAGALAAAVTYLHIVLPATFFLGLGMAFSSTLRAVGDAKGAMYVTLAGAVVSACLDPLFIFGLHLGIVGAALVLVLSRFCVFLVGWRGAVRVHDLVARPDTGRLWADLKALGAVAGPAVLTNLATPVANIYTVHVFSRFGDAAIAAFAIMDRVTPVAFGVLFALSGSVGPIMGQNYGARAIDRVRRVLTNCYSLAGCYVAGIALILWWAAPLVVDAFGAKGETADLLWFFCRASGALWLFLGMIFVANAAFNNLGWPVLSAVLNWSRATLGTIPFVTVGAAYGGPRGGYLSLIGGAVVFGCLAVGVSYVLVGRIAARVLAQAASD